MSVVTQPTITSADASGDPKQTHRTHAFVVWLGFTALNMGKKKGKRSGGRRASDKIALESAVDEDVMDGVTGDLDILDDLDREELEEEVALRQKLDRGRRANAYAEENQVFAISDSDSDDDFADPEVAMKRMKKKKKKTTNESKDQDDFASDLDESG